MLFVSVSKDILYCTFFSYRYSPSESSLKVTLGALSAAPANVTWDSTERLFLCYIKTLWSLHFLQCQNTKNNCSRRTILLVYCHITYIWLFCLGPVSFSLSTISITLLDRAVKSASICHFNLQNWEIRCCFCLRTSRTCCFMQEFWVVNLQP